MYIFQFKCDCVNFVFVLQYATVGRKFNITFWTLIEFKEKYFCGNFEFSLTMNNVWVTIYGQTKVILVYILNSLPLKILSFALEPSKFQSLNSNSSRENFGFILTGDNLWQTTVIFVYILNLFCYRTVQVVPGEFWIHFERETIYGGQRSYLFIF